MLSAVTAFLLACAKLFGWLEEDGRRRAKFDERNFAIARLNEAKDNSLEILRLQALHTPDGDAAAQRLLDYAAAIASVVSTATDAPPPSPPANPH